MANGQTASEAVLQRRIEDAIRRIEDGKRKKLNCDGHTDLADGVIVSIEIGQEILRVIKPSSSAGPGSDRSGPATSTQGWGIVDLKKRELRGPVAVVAVVAALFVVGMVAMVYLTVSTRSQQSHMLRQLAAIRGVDIPGGTEEK